MSCYITTDANAVVTRDFVGDGNFQLDGGVGRSWDYVPPTCDGAAWRLLSNALGEEPH